LVEFFPIAVAVYDARHTVWFSIGNANNFAEQEKCILQRSGKYLIQHQQWRNRTIIILYDLNVLN